MIKFTQGDIFRADVEAIVNTVNCVGIMGRGIALQFKKAYPANFAAYAEACNNKEVQPGKMFVFNTQQLTNPHFIINFPTKRHWKGASRIEDIELGLNALVTTVQENQIKSIAIPPLGAGLGGLDWALVREKIEQSLSVLDEVQILVYEPQGAQETDKVVRNKKVPNMTPGRAVLVELIQRYLSGLLDPTVSLLEVHKLLYFMQEAGEPLKLKFQKAHYGPYAENLRHVLNAIEGHLISGYSDGGDDPQKQLSLVPGAIEDAKLFLQKHPETLERFNKVSDLVEGFESPFGLELLASVHWVQKQESLNQVNDIIKAVHSWNQRKEKQFSPRQIQVAADALHNYQWA
jgi:O-acetyl-ADP-ribose deacetylase (regulator of RNase III)